LHIEDLILEDDAREHWENISDLDAFIVVAVDDGEISYGYAVNPDIDPQREKGALGWCAQLVTWIEDLGFDQAMGHGRLAVSQRRAMTIMEPGD